MPSQDLPDSRYVSTAQAANSLGVGISTIKRWVDQGILPAHRTAGGHRKLLRAEVLELGRRGQLPLDDFSPLLVPAGRRRKATDLASIREALTVALLTGDAATPRDLLRQAHRAGVAIEQLADQVIAPAMAAVGHGWEETRIEVWQEHRGTQLCVAALYDLLADLEQRAERDRPVALGGAPAGDPYILPTLLAQLVLLDAGWRAVNLGPDTPTTSFIQAIDELRPRLVWIAASHLRDPEAFLAEHAALFQAAERAGAAVAIGGRALDEEVRRRMAYTTHGDGMSHLAAFARSLHLRPGRPKRGRPRGR